MAVIRPIIAERGLDVGGVPNTRVSDAVGQGLQQVGGALMRAADAQSDIQLRQERMKMENAAFRSDQELRRFSDGFALEFATRQQQIDPSGEGFTEAVSTEFNKKAETFLQTVPEALKPRFVELVKTSRETWINKAAAAEIDQRNAWFRDGIVKTQEGLQTQVFNDPTLFDAAKQDGFRAIDASGLPAVEKQKLKDAWDETLALTLGQRAVQDAETDPASAASAAQRLGIGNSTAMSLLRKFEGFRPTPYWDVNAHRIGYGSDTITRADGSVVQVAPGMSVTRADAERDLARRAAEFENRAAGQVGVDAWARLPENARAALTSVAYNYGSLPKGVVAAVKGGDIGSIAGAVEALSGHNNGINAKRRKEEAAVIRGGALADNADPQFAPLSLTQRLELLDQINAAAKRGETAIRAQTQAAYEAHKGEIELGIETGTVASVQTILKDQVLTDAHKADLLSALRTRQGDAMAVNEAVQLFSQGQLAVDPYDAKGKKTVDGVWDAVSKAAPDQAQRTLENIVAQTGVVPASALNQLRAALTSRNLPQVAEAAQMAQRLSTIDPAALSRRDGGSEVQKMADDFGFYVNRLNLSPEDAARRMIEARDPEKQRDRKALEPAAKEFIKTLDDFNLSSAFDDSLGGLASDPSLGFTPAQQAGILADFRAIAEDQFFAVNGDPEMAKNRAIEEMKRLYGVTEFGGAKAVVKHPPEKHWPVSRHESSTWADRIGLNGYYREQMPSLDYARKQLEADIAKALPGVDIDSVQLVTTPETDAQVKRGEIPGYAVLFKDKDGVFQTIPGKLWRPEVTEAVRVEGQRQAVDQQMRIERARQSQELNRRVIQDVPKVLQGSGMQNNPIMAEPPATPSSTIQDQRQQLMEGAEDSGMLAPTPWGAL